MAKWPKQSSGEEPSQSDLRYKNLQKEHERVELLFQNNQEQLTHELEEKEKDAEELADLARTKCKVIKS